MGPKPHSIKEVICNKKLKLHAIKVSFQIKDPFIAVSFTTVHVVIGILWLCCPHYDTSL